MEKMLKELREAYRAEARRLAAIDRAIELFRALNARVLEAKKERLG
jgi:hypothetical protein